MTQLIQDINYHRFLPEELHQDADNLVDYFTYAPFEQPTACPYCGNPHFTGGRDDKKPYWCGRCQRAFSAHTGTPFANCRHHELWGAYAASRLSGLSWKKVSESIGLSTGACKYREKVFNQEMESQFPVLFQWWHAHQERHDLTLTPEVDVQHQQLQSWLEQLRTQPTATCPQCAAVSVRVKETRPDFRCHHCQSSFSLLAGTPLVKTWYMELWPEFLNGLVTGESAWDLSRRLGVTNKRLYQWRRSFLQVMEDKGLDALLEWSRWQRSRRYSQVTKLTREGVEFPVPGRSRMNRRKSRKVQQPEDQ
ncbi:MULTISPECIES: hypothetical protein [unclassified Serratia (in: enterobacteria)]|uniref:hypothetical protein n=1 Tax=unclassified Serratia (in: enterobacteria) TaxID=2647522 RepID=UPI0012680C99|nr:MULTISPECIES: hypothetical protein [unclassified Serratia (in: enterobacteria)]